MDSVNFLIENNYANSEKAASRILEAASDEFKEYIYEMNKQWLKKQALKLTKTAAKTTLKSKPAQAVKRFVKYTALGALIP
jgi:hypothetical protein